MCCVDVTEFMLRVRRLYGGLWWSARKCSGWVAGRQLYAIITFAWLSFILCPPAFLYSHSPGVFVSLVLSFFSFLASNLHLQRSPFSRLVSSHFHSFFFSFPFSPSLPYLTNSNNITKFRSLNLPRKRRAAANLLLIFEQTNACLEESLSSLCLCRAAHHVTFCHFFCHFPRFCDLLSTSYLSWSFSSSIRIRLAS